MEVLLNALEDAQNAFGNKRAAYKGSFFFIFPPLMPKGAQQDAAYQFAVTLIY